MEKSTIKSIRRISTNDLKVYNLKVKINGTWQPVQLDNNRMTAIKARALLSNMTDEDIEKVLTSKGISFK